MVENFDAEVNGLFIGESAHLAGGKRPTGDGNVLRARWRFKSLKWSENNIGEVAVCPEQCTCDSRYKACEANRTNVTQHTGHDRVSKIEEECRTTIQQS